MCYANEQNILCSFTVYKAKVTVHTSTANNSWLPMAQHEVVGPREGNRLQEEDDNLIKNPTLYVPGTRNQVLYVTDHVL